MMTTTLFKNIDCLGVLVPDLDEALTFYREKLGHKLVWRTESAAGLALAAAGEMPELVLHSDPWPISAAIRVDSVPEALERFVSSGGSIVEPASDIPIGKLAVVSDPWGNRLVLLDATKGRLWTDDEGNVTGVRPTE